MLGLHESIVFSANLHVRDEITGEEIASYQRQDEMLRIKDAAFHLLRYRQRSRAELRFRLLQKEFDSTAVDQVIDEFTTKGYLNDEQFAREFAEDQLTRKNIGPLRLQSELNKKQVPEKIIQQILSEMYEKYDPYQLAEAAAEKKMREERSKDYLTRYRRVSNYLARRGFKWEIISEILEKRLKP